MKVIQVNCNFLSCVCFSKIVPLEGYGSIKKISGSYFSEADFTYRIRANFSASERFQILNVKIVGAIIISLDQLQA